MSGFSQIPSNVLVPGTYIETNSTNAATDVTQNQRIMVIGQKKSGGTIAALTPTLITSYNQAVEGFGAASMLANMFKVLFDNNPNTEKWAIALDDVGGGTAASGSITVTASGVVGGTLSLYMGGVLVPVTVVTGDDDDNIAAAIIAAINANTEIPVTAVVDGSDDAKVNLTYDHKGLVGNKYDIRLNYAGPSAGEVTPTGVSLNIVQLASGATDPDVATAFAVMPDQIFNYIVMPYIASANLNAADAEMTSRWNAMRMLDGHVFVSDRGSVGTMSTLGNGRNGPHVSLFDAGNNSPTPPYLWVAALTGQVAAQASVDPALPFNGLVLNDVLAPPQANRRTQNERQTLLSDGVATHYIGNDGRPYIERLTTTYQTSGVGLPDNTYRDANTPFTLSYIKQDLRAHLNSRFPRFKLADDGVNTSPGSNVITPSGIKAEVVAKAQDWQARGLIEDIAGFISSIVVVRDTNDPTRVNVFIYPNLVNQLQVIAVSINFTL